jgi:hypothetical protein
LESYERERRSHVPHVHVTENIERKPNGGIELL